MNRHAVLVSVLIGCCFGAVNAQQQDFEKVVIKPTHVNGNVHMLEGSGGNIGVSVGPDGVLIVDDQFAPLAEKIRAAVRALNPGALKFVLNTHFHGDHTGGNPIFGREAAIVAHTNVRNRLAKEQRSGDRVTPPMVKEGLPVITFDQGVSLYFNGEEIRLIHQPNGHTDTDAFIYFTRSNVLHMGDTFFNGRFPYIDLGGGGSVDGLIRNIGNAVNMIAYDTRIIPGHGALGSKEDLRAYHNMLIETTDHVRAMMAKDASVDEIKKAGFPEKWQGWGAGFISADRWIDTIYQNTGR